MKKILFLIVIVSISFLLLQCSENPVEIIQSTDAAGGSFAKGPGSGGGGGGHTTTQVNNLSFPVLCADGFSIIPIPNTEGQFGVIYTGPYTGLTAEQLALLTGYDWYAQKVEGNVWQAEYQSVANAEVYFVDWGDAMESVDPKVNRPYRLELALYAHLTDPLSAYTMAELAFPSSPQETQGTNTIKYSSDYATITTPKGNLVVQKYEPNATLTWNGSYWDGAYPPEDVTFAQELNVGGKYIFGASQGGWKPTEEAEFRITFYFDNTNGPSSVSLSAAQPGDYNGGTPIIPKIGENNTAIVDPINNITYIDVTVVQPGGGGGGGGH